VRLLLSYYFRLKIEISCFLPRSYGLFLTDEDDNEAVEEDDGTDEEDDSDDDPPQSKRQRLSMYYSYKYVL